MKWLGKVQLVAAVFASASAWCADIPGYPDDVNYSFDPRELALLPEYCKYTQLFRQRLHADPAKVAHWYAVMGPAFDAMHHYCWGLMKTNRALLLANSQRVRTFYMDDSLAEFDYVIRSALPDFVMLPEIYTKKGENQLRLGRIAAGIASLQRAIELKADYWPPYAALSDHYKKAGDIEQARAWLQKAVAFAPDAKALKSRLAELDRAAAKPRR